MGDIISDLRRIRESLTDERDVEAFDNADSALYAAFSQVFSSVGPEDLRRSLNGETVRKKPVDMAEAMAALAALRELGARAGVDIPLIGNQKEFLVWLVREYGRAVLKDTVRRR